MSKNTDNKERNKYIRLPVKEQIEIGGYGFSERKKEEIPVRNYIDGVDEILDSTFKLRGKKLLIYKIKISGNPTPSQIDDILNWLGAEPTVYLSPDVILVKSKSDNFNKKAPKLKKGGIHVIKRFVEDISLQHSKEKMSSEMSDIIFNDKKEKDLKLLDLIIFFVPGFSKIEYQDLMNQISSLISESNKIEMFDKQNGIVLSSTSVEDVRNFIQEPYIFQISSDIETQSFDTIHTKNNFLKKILPCNDDPIVCIIDTGADQETLGDALIDSSFEENFKDGSDEHGHGTCVSSVAVWGQDLFLEKEEIHGRCRVVSHKFLSGNSGTMSELFRATHNAIDKYHNKVRIFNLSTNCSKPYEEAVPLVTYLDKKIQEKNIILVNSIGNIPKEWIETTGIQWGYPRYLKYFPILHPADGNNVVGVGAFALKSSNNLAQKYQISPYSPLGKSKYTHNIAQKPEIIVKGGNWDLNDGKIIVPTDLRLPLLGKSNQYIRAIPGTSFSAPLAASLFAQLWGTYKDILNSETLKALFFSCSELIDTESGIIFQLHNEENLFYLKDSLIYYGEGIIPAKIEYFAGHERRYTSNQLKFFIPEKAKKIRIISVHSDDLPISKLGLMGSILKFDIFKPDRRTKIKKEEADVWYLNRNTPINFAIFKATVGEWQIRLTVYTEHLPRTLTNTLMVRYGLGIRIDLEQ